MLITVLLPPTSRQFLSWKFVSSHPPCCLLQQKIYIYEKPHKTSLYFLKMVGNWKLEYKIIDLKKKFNIKLFYCLVPFRIKNLVFYFFIFGCAGSLQPHKFFSSCGVQASPCSGFSQCGAWALEHRLSSCATWAWLFHSMWDLPRSGIEPMSPALAGGFFLLWSHQESQES